jgi:5-(carboxyamino)imidazole ribonucleotide synthase
MMALEAHRLGMEPVVLSLNPMDPAAQVTPHWLKGEGTQLAAAVRLLENVDVATFESEFMDADLLTKASRQTRTPIFPRPALMKELQDRWTQKNLLEQSGLPTAEFIKVETAVDFETAVEKFGTQFVLKKRLGGYDGYGTFITRTTAEVARLRQSLAAQWPKGTASRARGDRRDSANVGFIAERRIDFKRELALMAGRDRQGNFFRLPLVESHQESARCDWVCGPCQHPRLAPLLKKIAQFLARNDYVGIMGFELFETQGQLLINEIAPRVHNSAHYSQLALSEDQFSLHVKAVTGGRCESPQILAPAFAMANLLGRSSRQITWAQDLRGQLHLYQKLENRPGRKMGHLNIVGKSLKKALDQALTERKKIKL